VIDYNKAVEDILTSVRLNSDSVEKQISFLKEGMEMVKNLTDMEVQKEKLLQVQLLLCDKHQGLSEFLVFLRQKCKKRLE
jgi:hypothetical protein